MLTVREAAEILRITTQAIRVAIRSGKLKSAKIGKRVRIETNDLNAYAANRWKRGARFGEYEFSPLMAAEFIGIPIQRVYHLLRTNRMAFWKQAKQTITIPIGELLRVQNRERLRFKKKKARMEGKKKIRRKKSDVSQSKKTKTKTKSDYMRATKPT